MKALNTPTLTGSSTLGVNVRRAACSCHLATHQHTISTVTASAVRKEEAAVASTSQPDVVGRRAALGLLAITPVLAQSQNAWAVQVSVGTGGLDTSPHLRASLVYQVAYQGV